MEYFVGPILTLLLAMKFSDYQSKQVEKKITAVSTKVEMVEKVMQEKEAELPKKVMATVIPLATAVKKINQQIGL